MSAIFSSRFFMRPNTWHFKLFLNIKHSIGLISAVPSIKIQNQALILFGIHVEGSIYNYNYYKKQTKQTNKETKKSTLKTPQKPSTTPEHWFKLTRSGPSIHFSVLYLNLVKYVRNSGLATLAWTLTYRWFIKMKKNDLDRTSFFSSFGITWSSVLLTVGNQCQGGWLDSKPCEGLAVFYSLCRIFNAFGWHMFQVSQSLHFHILSPSVL